MNNPLTAEKIDWLVTLALEEDLGSGDITTDRIVDPNTVMQAVVTAKEPMVVCGLDIVRAVFLKLDPDVQFTNPGVQDGDEVGQGTPLLEAKGSCAALLKGERSALNILQRLSGIATLTRQYVNRVKPVTVLDTRKTTPGIRAFEKYAVHCGGGTNHRFGLFDAVLIKDNHIKVAGGILPAVQKVKQTPSSAGIEVETTNLKEVQEALEAGADIILLDNMPLEMLRQAARLINGKAKTEVSGSISLDRLDEIATLGVDSVSVGALTHSAPAKDISMNFQIV